MAIDPKTETLIQFEDAANAFPGIKPDPRTLHRWRSKGIGGVKLDAIKIGAKFFTSKEGIERFITAQNAS